MTLGKTNNNDTHANGNGKSIPTSANGNHHSAATTTTTMITNGVHQHIEKDQQPPPNFNDIVMDNAALEAAGNSTVVANANAAAITSKQVSPIRKCDFLFSFL